MPGSTQSKDIGFEMLRSLPERRSLGQHAYEKLKQAIVKGDLAPGSRVIEIRVANVLGISRTPVREASHKLEREGLLCHGPSGGFFVVGLMKADIEEKKYIGWDDVRLPTLKALRRRGFLPEARCRTGRPPCRE